MTEPVTVGMLVSVTDGPHVGKQGEVTEIYRDWHIGGFRAWVELPDHKGFFQTRLEWLVRLP